MIDIIIPAYNSHNTIKKNLSSIANQSIIDKCNVVIVNDGSRVDYSEEINFFKKYMNIIELTISKNQGVGYARQFGLENSKSEFLMFVDSDDCLNDYFSIENLYKSIILGYDLILSYVLVEDKTKKFSLENFFCGNLHGKMYRREFLTNNSIKFNNFRIHEDNCFNQEIILNNPKINCINEVTYIYKNNVNSLTNSMDKYNLKYIDSMVYVMDKMKRENDLSYNNFIFSTILYLYYFYLDIDSEVEKNKYLKKCSNVYKYYKKYCTNNVDKDRIIKEKVVDILKKNIMVEKYLLPTISFNEFINLIKK